MPAVAKMSSRSRVGDTRLASLKWGEGASGGWLDVVAAPRGGRGGGPEALNRTCPMRRGAGGALSAAAPPPSAGAAMERAIQF